MPTVCTMTDEHAYPSFTKLPVEPLSKEQRDAAHSALKKFFILGVAAQNIILFSDTQLIMTCVNGDPGKAAAAVATTSSAAGLVEFFVNPALGKLADQFGRKFVFYIGPVCASMTMSAAVLLTSGKSLPVLLVHRTMNWSFNAMSGSFIAPIVCSDMFSGAELGVRMGSVFGAIGISASLAPGAGSIVMSRTGSPLTPYKIRFLIAIAQVCFATRCIPETLEACNQRAFHLADAIPFKFVKLFAKKGALRTLSTMLFFHCFLEGKVMASFCQGWMNGPPLHWSLRLQSLHSLVFGFLMYVSGTYFMPWLVRRKGPRDFTSIANTMSAAGLVLSGFPWPFGYAGSIWAGLLVHMPGINGTSAAAIKGLAADHAVANGFGRGEYGGMYSSVRNLAIFCAPLLYGYTYKRATATKKLNTMQLWMPWLLMSFLGAALPEFLHRSLSDEELLNVGPIVPTPQASASRRFSISPAAPRSSR